MGNNLVLVTAPVFANDADSVAKLRSAGLELRVAPYSPNRSESELIELLHGAVAAIPVQDPFTRRVLEASPDLRVVARMGVGLESIDLRAAADHGVVVAAPRGVNAVSVAEHALLLMLALSRNLLAADRVVRGGGWARWPGTELDGKTLGLVGVGATGRALASRAAALGLRVIGHDPFVADVVGIELLSLEDVLRQADVVSLHLPVTAETRQRIGRAELGLMKPTAVLINTARGAVLDYDALVEALRTGTIAGAGLDVFDPEPPAASALFELENVVLTPHLAGATHEANRRGSRAAAQSILEVLSGQPCTHRVLGVE